MFWNSWVNNNIFKHRKGDSIAYFFLYIVIPIIITVVSLAGVQTDGIAVIYCYLTILISAINSIYDGANRWDYNKKTVCNFKLFLVFVSNGIITVYCLYIILGTLIFNTVPVRLDWILFVYLITIAISGFDIVTCFTRDIAVRDYV